MENGKLYWIYYLRKEGKSNFIGGEPWGGISADTRNGLVFLTTGNPKPNFVGVMRPGKNLYANSLIAFDIRNKKNQVFSNDQDICYISLKLYTKHIILILSVHAYRTQLCTILAARRQFNRIA